MQLDMVLYIQVQNLAFYYVIQSGLHAFIWKESRNVLTKQRLNLQKHPKKDDLQPNFVDLTKSYSKVLVASQAPQMLWLHKGMQL